MIPVMNIIAWGNVVPWTDQRQIEQDLVISRVLVELFSNPLLRDAVRFRGGTALNKLHFPRPLRYSEDIDLVRTTRGPIKPILRAVRETLEPWLGEASFDSSPHSPKLRFKAPAEGAASAEIRLKVEINTREIDPCDRPLSLPFSVDNAWFTGRADIATFSREEILATKLRALLQRNKGRDLFDLAHALDVFDGLNTTRVVECLQYYLKLSNAKISRPQAQERMFDKLADPSFLKDMRPLLAADQAEKLDDAAIKAAFAKVYFGLITQIPGEAWASAEEFEEKHGLAKVSVSAD